MRASARYRTASSARSSWRRSAAWGCTCATRSSASGSAASTWAPARRTRRRRTESSRDRRRVGRSARPLPAEASSKHPDLFGMEQGDDLFSQDFGRPQDFDAEDVAYIAKFDRDPRRDLNGAGDLSLLREEIKHIGLGVIADFGFCNHAFHLPFLIFLSTSRSSSG